MATTVPIRKAYVDTPHGQLHYRYAIPSTPSKPTLLLLHKSASSSISFEALINHYAALGHPCYAPDMPGFGASFDPSEATIAEIQKLHTRWYCDLYVDAFTKLGVLGEGKPKVHLIGHHSGAALSLELGYLHPDKIASVALVGATVMTAADRARMKEAYFAPFNQPVADGSHLTKTWNYLKTMGVGEDLGMYQREAIDHIRAWKGRMLIYGAVWEQEEEEMMSGVKVPVLAMCARDDVLWEFFGNVKKLRPDVQCEEVKGSNFSLDHDWEGIVKVWTPFMEKNAL